jgi:hypothetical protein
VIDNPISFAEVKRAINKLKKGNAPGLNGIPPEAFKAMDNIIKNYPSLDMTNHSRVCPGKMIVAITQGFVGLPSFPYPFHLMAIYQVSPTWNWDRLTC